MARAHLLLLPAREEVGDQRHGHRALAACCVVELVVEQHVRRAVAEPPVLLAPLGVGGGAVLLREPQLHPLVEVGGGDDGGLDRLLARVAVDGGDLLHVAHDEQPHLAAVLREAVEEGLDDALVQAGALVDDDEGGGAEERQPLGRQRATGLQLDGGVAVGVGVDGQHAEGVEAHAALEVGRGQVGGRADQWLAAEQHLLCVVRVWSVSEATWRHLGVTLVYHRSHLGGLYLAEPHAWRSVRSGEHRGSRALAATMLPYSCRTSTGVKSQDLFS